MAITLNQNLQLINEIYCGIPILNDNITETTNGIKKYCECLKEEEFIENMNEKEEEAIKRAESKYERMVEIINQYEISNKKAISTFNLLNKMTELFDKIVNNIELEKRKIANKINELIDNIVDLEERKMKVSSLKYPKRKKELKEEFKKKIKRWNEKKKEMKKQTEERSNKFNEVKQLEEWTKMKMGNVIFDSNIDNWSWNTSVFDEIIMNKNNLIFLIDDEDGNRFGSYVNSKIDKIGEFISDANSFVFSLKSNGRLNDMMKFNIKDPSYAFSICNQSNNKSLSIRFIGIGDIVFGNDKKKQESYCYQNSFDYNGFENALCGKETFILKRIQVIQFI